MNLEETFAAPVLPSFERRHCSEICPAGYACHSVNPAIH
jgi:hypothetical protein